MSLSKWQKALTKKAKLYLVGGKVRDAMLGLADRDLDVDYLVRGIPPDELETILKGHGRLQLVGKSFGVYKFKPEGDCVEVDIAYPRREVSTGPGHRDFSIECDWEMPVEEDLARRDFTMNAMARSVKDGVLIDPCGGERDIDARILRMIFEKAFEEDPLRILRGVRFAATFSLTIDPETYEAMKGSVTLLSTLSPERVQEEFTKCMTQCEKPSGAFDAMRELGALAILLPELERAFGVEQNEYHPDDVYWHSLKTCDAARVGHPAPDAAATERSLIRWAALLHDLGKVDRKRTITEDGEQRVVFYGHETVSATLAGQVLKRLRFSGDFVKRCVHLVAEHMFHYQPEWNRASVRRFIRRVGANNLEDLYALRTADCLSRGLHDDVAKLDELRRRVQLEFDEKKALKIADLAIGGKDIMNVLGIEAGERVGQVLQELFERVLDDPSLNTPGALRSIVIRDYNKEGGE